MKKKKDTNMTERRINFLVNTKEQKQALQQVAYKRYPNNLTNPINDLMRDIVTNFLIQNHENKTHKNR